MISLDVEGDSKIMGKMAGMDEKMHKSTYVSLFTLEGAKAMALDTLKESRTYPGTFWRKGGTAPCDCTASVQSQ